jgi:hypothetical protein
MYPYTEEARQIYPLTGYAFFIPVAGTLAPAGSLVFSRLMDDWIDTARVSVPFDLYSESRLYCAPIQY